MQDSSVLIIMALMRSNLANFIATSLAVWVLAVAPCSCAEPQDLSHSDHCDCSFCPDCLQISSEQLVLKTSSELKTDKNSFDEPLSFFASPLIGANLAFNHTVRFHQDTVLKKRKISFAKLERGPPASYI